MCLKIVDYVRKDKIKYVYKLFDLRKNKLYAYVVSNYIYKPGYNYPRGKINIQNWMVEGGILHVYRSINELSCFQYKNGVILRFPVVLEDILYYGAKKDVGLKKLFIPKNLYERAINQDKPNITLKTSLKVYW